MNEFNYIVDPTGKTDKYFAIAGANDMDGQSATTTLTTPGFLSAEHPSECLNFWYKIQVGVLLYYFNSKFFAPNIATSTYVINPSYS